MDARKVIAVIALAFFFGPIGLRAVGVTARPFENRRLATFPKPSQGWDALDQGKRFFVDRMPLREQAVRADAWISTNVFSTQPSAGRAGAGDSAGLPFKAPAAPKKPAAAPPPGDKAVAGKQGWLFLEGELVRACVPFTPWSTAIGRWERLAQIIRRSGRRVVVVFPPDKSTIYPEYLPAAFAQRDCAGPGHDAAWKAIEGAKDPAILGLRQAMLAAKRPPPEAIYLRKDTHWNTAGGTLAVGRVLERLGGAVRLRPGEVVKDHARYQGDLSVLSGAPEIDSTPRWVVRRAAGAPQIPGRTLFVYDSFGTAMQDALAAYPRSLTLLPWYLTPPEKIVAAIRGADSVVIETVEREVNYRASDLGVVTPSFLRQLRLALRR